MCIRDRPTSLPTLGPTLPLPARPTRPAMHPACKQTQPSPPPQGGRTRRRSSRAGDREGHAHPGQQKDGR
eukprot:5772260-Alexandrium_andersonii.AAC.1